MCKQACRWVGELLPVEPVVCVARKWVGVVAAEVVAGVGVLKRSKTDAFHEHNNVPRKQRRLLTNEWKGSVIVTGGHVVLDVEIGRLHGEQHAVVSAW